MRTFPASFSLLALASLTGVTAEDTPPHIQPVPAEFPTSVYAAYWNSLISSICSAAPRTIFPANLTDPANFPKNDTVDPHPLPLQQEPSQLLQAFSQIKSTANNPALAAPEQGPLLAGAVCEHSSYSAYGLGPSCYSEFSELALGSVFSQVITLGDMGGYDGQLLCARKLSSMPPAVPLNPTGWFPNPVPTPLPPPKQPMGNA